MRVKQITKNAYQLTKYGVVNCYLVRDGDDLTLVDAALKNCHSAIEKAADGLGMPITRIMLTHAHEDHVGATDALMARYPSAELLASARSLPLLRRTPDKALIGDEDRGRGENAIKGPIPSIASVPTRTIADGEKVGSLRVIDTPGHIPGHVVMLDERDGTLFAGDALMAMGRVRLCTDSPWYLPQRHFSWSAPLAIANARRLLDYPVERFACGHGKVRTGSKETLRQAIARAERT